MKPFDWSPEGDEKRMERARRESPREFMVKPRDSDRFVLSAEAQTYVESLSRVQETT